MEHEGDHQRTGGVGVGGDAQRDANEDGVEDDACLKGERDGCEVEAALEGGRLIQGLLGVSVNNLSLVDLSLDPGGTLLEIVPQDVLQAEGEKSCESGEGHCMCAVYCEFSLTLRSYSLPCPQILSCFLPCSRMKHKL